MNYTVKLKEEEEKFREPARTLKKSQFIASKKLFNKREDIPKSNQEIYSFLKEPFFSNIFFSIELPKLYVKNPSKEGFPEEKFKILEFIKELFEKIGNLERKLNILENKVEESYLIKPIPEKYRQNQKFLEEEEWIRKNKKKFENEIIIFKKDEDNNLKLLGHSKEKIKLLKKIDELYENMILDENDRIFFR